MSRQLELLPRPARARPRVLMHVVDAGHGPGPGKWAAFQCLKCQHRSDWQPIESVTEAKRGVPCPNCNATPTRPT